MNTFDPLLHKRASRYDATVRRDSPCVITERDLDILYALFIHGKLSTAMIRALVSPKSSHEAVRGRLMDLKRDVIPLIEQPWQQEGNLYDFLIFEITAAGIQVLLDAGRIEERHLAWRKGVFSSKTWYDHEVMSSFTAASIELGCKERGLEYISWLDILDSPDCPEATKAQKNPLAIKMPDGKHKAITDGLCGVGDDEGYSFFVKEDDRNNTPTEIRDETKRKEAKDRPAYSKHIADWRWIIGSGEYKRHFGIQNLHVLNITVSSQRMERIMDHLREVTQSREKGLTGPAAFLFLAAHSLAKRRYRIKPYVPKEQRKREYPKRIKDEILSASWKRVGLPDQKLVK